MVSSSCVVGCSNRHSTSAGCGKSFFRFPVSESRRSKWVAAIRRVEPNGKLWYPSRNDRVCFDHFHSGNPSADPSHPDYTPSLKMGYLSSASVASERALLRSRRRQVLDDRRAEQAQQEIEKRKQEECAREAERRDIEARRSLVELDHLYCFSLGHPEKTDDVTDHLR